MRLLSTAFIVAITITPGFASDKPAPREVFDRAFGWLVENQMANGLVVSDSDDPFHLIRAELFPAPEEMKKIDVGFLGRTTIEGMPVLVNSDKTKMLAPTNGTLSAVKPGERIPGATQFVLTDISEQAITARLTFLYDNIDATDALLEMFKKTQDQKYLSSAGEILKNSYALADTDGKFRLNFATLGPIYMGMPQAILMRSLSEYFELSKEKWADEALDRLAVGYEHTTEGTWDHWSNSISGMLIAHSRGTISNETVEQFWKPYLYRLLEQAHLGNGAIAQTMDSAHQVWPDYKDTYQGYNLLLLLTLAKMDSSVSPAICDEFPSMYKATKDVGGGKYAGRKVIAARLGDELCGVASADFIANEFANLPDTIQSVEDAIGALMISAVALQPSPQETQPLKN